MKTAFCMYRPGEKHRAMVRRPGYPADGNRLADADIKGIDDEFFVVVPDSEHVGCFLPYLYVVLEDGYTIDDIEDKVRECLDDYMQPVEIIELSERPFFHFKTNRIGLTKTILKEQLKKVPGELRRANA